eukprot:CAMPEP_0115495052 /NCGR_PEP_ID=MMETSP0271-20121206/65050_1 /TAXON_ID=71861 /ORGANISM="Scrippsiella trochoidea, Strain CCMP3099" /LENGTH=80 /DNA_ID=CAMNT_0002923677 /DNA_START=511 /DNA_END=753 /DNA_ORIENTATION=+
MADHVFGPSHLLSEELRCEYAEALLQHREPRLQRRHVDPPTHAAKKRLVLRPQVPVPTARYGVAPHLHAKLNLILKVASP